MTRIAVFVNDGSPMHIAPPDLYTRGLGGAENALVSLMAEFAKRGHEVFVFNDSYHPGDHDGVLYLPKSNLHDAYTNFDVMIFFRSPNDEVSRERNRDTLKIFWSCDQFTRGDYAPFLRAVDRTVCISPRHVAYFREHYAADERTVSIDLGVRVGEYAREVARVPHRLIFCSVPERGLMRLRAIWPRIKSAVPDASLVITGSHALWGGDDNTPPYRQAFGGMSDVHYFGAISRHQLIERQLEADIHAYPCVYDELFCIAAAECQVAGAVPFTSAEGALETTNSYGFLFPGNPYDDTWLSDWADRIIDSFHDDVPAKWRPHMMQQARERFSWSRIAEEWEALFNG